MGAGELLVADGVLHVEVAELLEARVALAGFGSSIRRAPLTRRSPGGCPLTAFDSHQTEAQVGNDIKARAALVVDGRKPPGEPVGEVAEWAQCL